MQKLVIPGEKISETPLNIENSLVEDNHTYATVVGMFDSDRKIIIPLEGLWYPKSNDTVVGTVEEDRFNSYTINLSAPYKGIIITKFLDTDIAVGDIIVATVKELDKTKVAILTRPEVLYGGKIITVQPSKIPRIIGKANTMVKQINGGTKTNIIIGLNGIIWLKGGNIDLATKAILKIEEEAHTTGLTERIKEMLEKEKV